MTKTPKTPNQMKLLKEESLEIETLQEEYKDQENKQLPLQVEEYDQSKDADFSQVLLGGRHFLIKAPPKQTKSNIIIDEKTRKNIQEIGDVPGFKENSKVAHVADKCELVQTGDLVLLSPHVQALEMAEQNVLYYIIHEDYVLAVKREKK